MTRLVGGTKINETCDCQSRLGGLLATSSLGSEICAFDDDDDDLIPKGKLTPVMRLWTQLHPVEGRQPFLQRHGELI